MVRCIVRSTHNAERTHTHKEKQQGFKLNFELWYCFLNIFFMFTMRVFWFRCYYSCHSHFFHIKIFSREFCSCLNLISCTMFIVMVFSCSSKVDKQIFHQLSTDWIHFEAPNISLPLRDVRLHLIKMCLSIKYFF